LSNAIDTFRARLRSEWLPAFCGDGQRCLDPTGFRDSSIHIGERDIGGGRYRCASSKAVEQIFWTGPKASSPRTLTLWMEPVITIATVARLHLDLDWPAERIGMQSSDWAFDFAAYNKDGARILLAGEVKKSVQEVDHLVADLQDCSAADASTALSENSRHINSFRKWSALRTYAVPLFWVVGPDDYTYVFRLLEGPERTTFEPATLEDLRFSGAMAR
jgi:hypothetical protein